MHQLNSRLWSTSMVEPKSQEQPASWKYQTLQNKALMMILGAFKTSPSMAMEIEAGLPPPAVRFEKLCNSYALRTLKFHKNNLAILPSSISQDQTLNSYPY
ncbi:hypothetical protein M501DRAFT_163962 [Patellaria atrata CBS 101060]|uniref:Uncharacterized protein n=1 Tax=Patellaria atrata CBS 101060 TaxID=1346257 RepID=A0A9P4S7K1_9PEZI|nr:hypothetical protein M501DRAFT_163962 [Patellaria atrata CBS 101060]